MNEDDFQIDVTAKRVTHKSGVIFEIDDSRPTITARARGNWNVLDPWCHRLRFEAIWHYRARTGKLTPMQEADDD